MKKGLIFSIFTTIMALAVLTLAGFYSTLAIRADINSEKATGVFDDIRTDFISLTGVDAECAEAGGKTVLVFNDRIPLENGVALMGEYERYMEGEYAGKLNSKINLTIGDPYLSIVPTGLAYGYPTYDKQSIRIYNTSGDCIGVEAYELYLSADGNFINATENTASGGLRLKLNATFPNGGYYADYMLSPSDHTTIVLNLKDSRITLSAGANTIDGAERNGSLVIGRQGDIKLGVVSRIVLKTTEEAAVKTNLEVDYTDVISKNDHIWLTPRTTQYNVTQTCNQYCANNGYADGQCEPNTNCPQGGTHQQPADQYCPGTGSEKYCCCDTTTTTT